jgi:hypothetical protein
MIDDDVLPAHKRAGYAEQMYEQADMRRKEQREDALLASADRGAYYYSSNREKVHFKTIARAIRDLHPHLEGHHIFAQLIALGLYEGFTKGETPCALPYSFTDIR